MGARPVVAVRIVVELSPMAEMASMIEIALIGAGRIGVVHADAIAALPDARLGCVADVDGDAARALSTRHGVPTATVEEALAGSADAVLIASATPMVIGARLSTAQYSRKLDTALRFSRVRQIMLNAFSILRSISTAVTTRNTMPTPVRFLACLEKSFR